MGPCIKKRTTILNNIVYQKDLSVWHGDNFYPTFALPIFLWIVFLPFEAPGQRGSLSVWSGNPAWAYWMEIWLVALVTGDQILRVCTIRSGSTCLLASLKEANICTESRQCWVLGFWFFFFFWVLSFKLLQTKAWKVPFIFFEQYVCSYLHVVE